MHNTYPIDQQIGDYALLQPLGHSASSEVYLGEHALTHTPVAIKRLRAPLTADEAQHFLLQTAALCQLRHPHIMPIRDFGVADDIAFLVMDYAPQGSLRQRHPRGNRVALEIVLAYVQQLAAALHYLHEQGLVHRDIKPHNMLLGAQGEILLSDFSTATRSFGLHPAQPRLADFEGTVLYAAPEQFQGQPRRRSDQYALAISIYEWLCGDWPFHGSFHEVVHQHLFVAPPALQEKGCICPPDVEKVILKALAKDPTMRFASVKLFADELAWAYKVALAKGSIALPTTSPQVAAIQLTAEPATAPLAASLPILEQITTPVQASQPPLRQFKAPLLTKKTCSPPKNYF